MPNVALFYTICFECVVPHLITSYHTSKSLLNSPIFPRRIECPTDHNDVVVHTNSLLGSEIVDIVSGVMASSTNSWTTIPRSEITITKLTGGLTNILYSVKPLKSVQENEEPVVIRIFGSGTSEIIDRQTENLIFSRLSQSKFGPPFYGLFENGRLEGYIEKAKDLTHIGQAEKHIYPLIADSLFQFHSMEILELCKQNSDCNSWLWDKMTLFINKALESYRIKKDQQLEHIQQGLDINSFQLEQVWLQSNLGHCPSSSSSSSLLNTPYDRGMRFGFDSVLCHNDVQPGNILLTYKDSSNSHMHAALIDYEYSMYNYRAFDIANHFCEYCGFDIDLSTFPDEKKRKAFLKVYLEKCASQVSEKEALVLKSEEFLMGFEKSVCKFVLASHLLWGAWAVFQALHSTIDFDYVKYATRRFAAYQFYKREFSDLFIDSHH